MTKEEANEILSDPLFSEIVNDRKEYGYWQYANFRKTPNCKGPASFLTASPVSLQFSGIYGKSISDAAYMVGNYGQNAAE